MKKIIPKDSNHKNKKPNLILLIIEITTHFIFIYINLNQYIQHNHLNQENVLYGLFSIILLIVGSMWATTKSAGSILFILRPTSLTILLLRIIYLIQIAFSKDLLLESIKDINISNFIELPASIILIIATVPAFTILSMVYLLSAIRKHLATIHLTLQRLSIERKNKLSAQIQSYMNTTTSSSKAVEKNTLDLIIAIGTTLLALSVFQNIISIPITDSLRQLLSSTQGMKDPQAFNSSIDSIYQLSLSILRSPTFLIVELVASLQLHKVLSNIIKELGNIETSEEPDSTTEASNKLYKIMQETLFTRIEMLIITAILISSLYISIQTIFTTFLPPYENISYPISILIAYHIGLNIIAIPYKQ